MKRNKAFKIISWVLVAACMVFIFAMSAQPADISDKTSDWVIVFLGLELSVDFVRTAAHFIEFAGLAVLVFNALYWSFEKFRPFLAFAISALYAVSDELHQLFVEGRSCQLTDILIDSAGALIGVAGALLLGRLILYFKGRRSV